MRTVSLALLATLLVGLAAAAPANNYALAHEHAALTLKSAVESLSTKLPNMQHHVGSTAHLNAHKFRGMQAVIPSPTCNQDSFSQAQVTVLQACPSLSGLVSGTVSQEEFLPGFCGSNCFNVIARELPSQIACLDGTSLFLVQIVQVCQATPRCFSEAVIRGSATIKRECPGLNALTDFTNLTAASHSQIATACTGGCVERQLTFAATYPECVTDDSGKAIPIAALRAFFGMLCTTYDGDYCAWNLRNTGRMSCDRNCRTDGSWCVTSERSCDPYLTSERLSSLCSPCFRTMVDFAGAIGQDPVELSTSVELLCGRVTPGDNTTGFCFPIAASAASQMSGASSGISDAVMGAVCATDAGKCLPRFLALGAASALTSARKSFKSCARAGASYLLSCIRTYEAAVRSAETTRVMGEILCAQNTANNYCFASAYGLMSDQCFQLAAYTQSCSSTCAASLDTTLTAAGCCLPLVNDFMRVILGGETAPMALLPAGVQTVPSGASSASFTFSRSMTTPLNRGDQPLNAVAICGNTSALWAAIETPCPASASAVRRNFTVALAWDRVNADAGFKNRLRASLRADTANALALPPSAIRGDDIVENNATRIQLRSSGQRQTTSTSSGCRYIFSVDTGSSASSAAAATTFDQKVATNSFATPAAATETTASCMSCLDARASSAASVAAPPTPAPPAGSPSSANVFAVSMITIAAIALSLVL